MKMLLISINHRPEFTPLALLYLKALLLNDRQLKHKCEVEIKVYNISDADELIISEIKDLHPQLIGFSCYVWNIEKVSSLSSKIKKIDKNIKIIMGGPQVTPIAEKIMAENDQIDIIVKGEGEITFLELIRSVIDSYEKIREIAGITFKDRGKIVNNVDREIISDLDSIPSPYRSGLFPLKGMSVCLETQRGCAFKCSFCYYNKSFRKIRYFSLERVKKELSFLLEKDLKSIYLMDPTFNYNKDRAKEICRFIIQNNKNNINFHTELRAELLDEEMADLLGKAKFNNLEIGLQSTNEKVLNLCKRKLDVQKFVNGINLLRKHRIRHEIHLIFGLPGETEDSFKNSLDFALDLNPRKLTIFTLQVLPGTEIWERSEEFGITFQNKPPYQFICSRSLPFDKAQKLRRLINGIDLFGNSLALRFLSEDSKVKISNIIESWIEGLNEREKELLFDYGKNRHVLIDSFMKFTKCFCEQKKLNFIFYNSIFD